MKRSLVLCLLMTLVLSYPAIAPAQDEVARSAPWIGNETYTVHADGTLRDVANELSKLTGVFITATGQQTDQPVVLDFEDARLDQILLSLCEQAGVVYEVLLLGRQIRLRPGDVEADSRPTVELEDYIVRVTRASVNAGRTYNFRWGDAEVDVPDYSDTFRLQIEVTARSENADRLLAGLDGKVKAITDEGDPLEHELPFGGVFPRPPPGFDEPRILAQSVSLPLPPEGATKITRLEGALREFSVVKTTEIDIKPGNEGATFEQDDVTGSVEQWQATGDQVNVVLALTCPSLGQDRQRFTMRYPCTIVLVANDGTEVRPGRSRVQQDGESRQLSLRFRLPDERPFEIDHLRVTLVRRGDASKVVPFVIENIPIP